MNSRRVPLEKKLKDKRFRINEIKFMKAFSSLKLPGATFVSLLRKSKLKRTTAYDHHHSLEDVLPDYERYLLIEYNKTISGKLKNENINLRTLYLETLMFIFRNREILRIFLCHDNVKIYKKILKKLKPKIILFARFPKESEKIYNIYEAEVIAIINKWAQQNFKEEQIGIILSDITYLTKTARLRLIPLAEQN